VQHERINEQIRVPRVRLVGEGGEQIGIKATSDALDAWWGFLDAVTPVGATV